MSCSVFNGLVSCATVSLLVFTLCVSHDSNSCPSAWLIPWNRPQACWSLMHCSPSYRATLCPGSLHRGSHQRDDSPHCLSSWCSLPLNESDIFALTCIRGNPRHLNKSNKSWVSGWVFTWQSAACRNRSCSQPPQSKVLFCTCVALFGVLLYLYLKFHRGSAPHVLSGHYWKTFLMLRWIIPSGTLKLSLQFFLKKRKRKGLIFQWQNNKRTQTMSDDASCHEDRWHFHVWLNILFLFFSFSLTVTRSGHATT